MNIKTARIDGTYDFGNCGIVPLIRVAGNKPKFKNNGYACFAGQEPLTVPGLYNALPDDGRQLRQGHVMLVYDDGGRFGTYAHAYSPDAAYNFS